MLFWVAPDKTFKVNLSNPTNSTLSTKTSATGTILNDDTPISLAVSDANAVETKAADIPNPGQSVLYWVQLLRQLSLHERD